MAGISEAIMCLQDNLPKTVRLYINRNGHHLLIRDNDGGIYPVFAGAYTDAECTMKSNVIIDGKEYNECAICRSSCPAWRSAATFHTILPLVLLLSILSFLPELCETTCSRTHGAIHTHILRCLYPILQKDCFY